MKKRGTEEMERPTVPRRDEEAGYRRDEKAICTPERERSGVQKSSHSHLYPREMKKWGKEEAERPSVPRRDEEAGYRSAVTVICTPERESSVEADGYGMALLKMEYTWGSNLAIQRIMVCIYITDSCSQETKSN